MTILDVKSDSSTSRDRQRKSTQELKDGYQPSGSQAKELTELGTATGVVTARTFSTGGRPLSQNPFQKSTPAYRILHHTLIKYRETMISIS
jgi:hypothetical protein